MTITQLANFICGKLSKTDAANVAFCKQALRMRWGIVYDARLWRQAVIPEMMTVTAETEIITIPATIGYTMALRFGTSQTLDPANWESLLRDDPMFYERHGTPVRFLKMGRDSSKRELIRLSSIPTTTEDMLIVGKAAFVPCDNDSDSPGDYLMGVDACLLAFGEGDMLEKLEMRSAASDKFTEATALMGTIKSIQDDQSAQTYEVAPMPVQLECTDW